MLGPVDPQLGNYPAVSILRLLPKRTPTEWTTRPHFGRHSFQGYGAGVNFVISLLEDKMEEEMAEEWLIKLTQGRWTHDFPITYDIISRLVSITRTCPPVSMT